MQSAVTLKQQIGLQTYARPGDATTNGKPVDAAGGEADRLLPFEEKHVATAFLLTYTKGEVMSDEQKLAITLNDLHRTLQKLDRAISSGSPRKILVTWKDVSRAQLRAGLTTIAARTEKAHQATKPAPTRTVASILDRIRGR